MEQHSLKYIFGVGFTALIFISSIVGVFIWAWHKFWWVEVAVGFFLIAVLISAIALFLGGILLSAYNDEDDGPQMG